MRILLVETRVPFTRPAARAAHAGMRSALTARGHLVDSVVLPLDPAREALAEQVLSYRLFSLAESSGERIDRLLALDALAGVLQHPGKMLWALRSGPGGSGARSEPRDEDSGAVAAREDGVTRRVEELALSESGRVWAGSSVVAQRLAARSGPASAEVVIPVAADAAGADAGASPGADRDLFVVAGVGGGRAVVDLALDVLSRVAAPTVFLVILDEDDAGLRTAWRARAEQRGLGDRLEVLDGPAADDLGGALAQARGLVHLAGGEEEAAGAAVEAGRCGRPVVVRADATAVREVVRDGWNGLAAAPAAEALADAVERLKSRPGLARDLGANGRQTVRELRLRLETLVEAVSA